MEQTTSRDKTANESRAGKAGGESWVKPRHARVRRILKAPLTAASHLLYRDLTIAPFAGSKDRQFLVLYDHQTPFDQFFVSQVFARPVYHVASEDIFSIGWPAKVMTYLTAPIPIRKHMNDMKATKTCVRVAREGGTIAIAPEGNRTYDGRTGHINPAVAKLAKLLKLPVAILRIEGGYGAEPRWSDTKRRGELKVYVSEVIEPEEIKDMEAGALAERLTKALAVDESGPGGTYTGKKTAEYMERLFYVCPNCGFSTMRSSGRIIRCQNCDLAAEYTDHKAFRPLGGDFPFGSIGEWYDYQQDFVRRMDPAGYLETPLYRDEAAVSVVRMYERKVPILPEASVRLFGDRIEVCRTGEVPVIVLPFEEVEAVTILGRNKLNVYSGGRVLQFKGGKRFNAVKYLNLYYHFRNLQKGERDDFLGL